MSVNSGRIISLPDDAAICSTQTQNHPPGGLGASARQEYPSAPQHRGGIADSWQFDLSVVVFLGPFVRHSCGIADAGTARTPKSVSFLHALLRTWHKQNQQSGNRKQATAHYNKSLNRDFHITFSSTTKLLYISLEYQICLMDITATRGDSSKSYGPAIISPSSP
jgi:hypothetical protein